MNWQSALTGLGALLLCAAALFLCAVFLWSVVEMTRVVLAHRQRMALIALGMHPDQPGAGRRDAGSPGAEVGSSGPGGGMT